MITLICIKASAIKSAWPVEFWDFPFFSRSLSISISFVLTCCWILSKLLLNLRLIENLDESSRGGHLYYSLVSTSWLVWNLINSNFFFSISMKDLESIAPWLSLIILCCRTFAVCFFCANIHDSAFKTSRILHDIELDLVEVKRFQVFLTSTKIAFNAKGFFWMTRKIIMTVRKMRAMVLKFLIAIFFLLYRLLEQLCEEIWWKIKLNLFERFFYRTYELVLVQFYDSEIKAGNLTSCTT